MTFPTTILIRTDQYYHHHRHRHSLLVMVVPSTMLEWSVPYDIHDVIDRRVSWSKWQSRIGMAMLVVLRHMDDDDDDGYYHHHDYY